ncbi:NADH-dependent [FeFe] hydrogenase, group A6 [Sphaerochaeta sp.]|uniref:NADH-dependent [FeFe] hydrogenase, group A6 n=1 Tax=Sphaerochaeta sp. TaxID=1972642 RepID=UPI002FCAA6EF
MDEQLIRLSVDGTMVEVCKGTRIIDACLQAGVKVPSLCYLKDISDHGSCGICMVEVEGAKRLIRSCQHVVLPNMVIHTHTQRVLQARRLNLELILANHPLTCTQCERNLQCELQSLSRQLGVAGSRFTRTKKHLLPLDETSSALVRDPNACILCNRCVQVCSAMQTVHAISMVNRGLQTKVATFFDEGLGNSVCTNCGQCSLVCPTAAITERDQADEVFAALSDPSLTVVVQTAPAIRVALGEALGLEQGSLVTGKMVSALRALGFDKVFDTQFTADLTIIEEANELLQRMATGRTLPMITSCSPGWIKFIETFYPDQLDHVSTCKSPQQMFGALAKTFYAEKAAVDPRSIRVVSIMPCTAKKFEAGRSEMDSAFDYWRDRMGLSEEERFADVDWALTTRELARMIGRIGLDFTRLPEGLFDDPLGESTGSAALFASSGGVMEAALRTAYEKVSGTLLEEVEFSALRQAQGIRQADIQIGEIKLKVAVANTLANARILLDQIRKGTSEYAFIEVMTCPDGCIGGGGQIRPTNQEVRERRAQAVYTEDRGKPIRKSHENPAIKSLYASFLGEPLGPMSHHLLHTSYTLRDQYR